MQECRWQQVSAQVGRLLTSGSMGWDVTLPQALAALAAWAVLSLAGSYIAITRLGAVQAVLALVLRRVLGRMELLVEADASIAGDGGRFTGRPRVRRTSTGACGFLTHANSEAQGNRC